MIDYPRKGDAWRWMIRPLRHYADFTGRSPAFEFWMFSLLLVGAYLLVALVVGALAVARFDEATAPVSIIGYLAVFLASFIPGLALTVRRFHDLGLSGHFTWLVYVAMLVLSVIGWIGYLVVMSLPGKKEANRWGAPVYDDNLPDVFA